MAMLSSIKKIVIDFAQAFDCFANEHSLDPVGIKLLDYSPINIAGDHSRKQFITFELSTKHRSYDFRLVFAAKALESWHRTAINNNALARFIAEYSFSTFKITEAIYNCEHRSLEIVLDRASILNSLFTGQTLQRDTVFAIYQRSYPGHNSLTNERIRYVWKILVRFLQKQSPSFQMIDGGLMNNLSDWNDKTNDYVELLRAHSQNLIAHPSNCKYLFCICHEQEYLKFECAKNILEDESYPITFLLIRVSSINIDQRDNYFAAIQDAINDCQIDCDSSNYRSILSSMIHLMNMFTSKLATPISPCPKHVVKRCVSLIYNVSRIRKVLQIYSDDYSQLASSKNPVDFATLSSDSDWFFIWHHLRLFDQTIAQLYEGLLDGNVRFEPNRILDQTRKLMHEFSVYYRNVKVLLEPVEHVQQLIRARIELFNVLLNRLTFFFALVNVNI